MQIPELQYYDRHGNQITPEEWVIEWKNKARVGYESLDECDVSTVYLGIDHGFGYTSQPLIFGTMVFCDDEDSPWYLYTERYASEGEALVGHRRIIDQIKQEKGDENEQ